MIKVQKNEQEKYPLPYYARMEILNRIIDELKGNKESEEIQFIIRVIKADRATMTFGLKLGRFLNLLTSDVKFVRLTDIGYRYSMMSNEQKRILLAESLPSYYLTFLKWIRDSSDRIMDTDKLKADILKNFNDWSPSPRVFNESLLTFGDVAEYCGFINFIKGRKGAKTRFQLTESGLKLLSDIKPVAENKQEVKEEIKKEHALDKELSVESKYPLRIQTRDNKFDMDMVDDIDWDIASTIIDKLKVKWQEHKIYEEDSKETERQQIKEIEANDKQMRKMIKEELT